MDEQRELKKDLTSIQGAIETQDGIYIPLSEVERLLMNRITQVKNCSIPLVSQQRELLAFRKWQKDNWKDVYLYSDEFMISEFKKANCG